MSVTEPICVQIAAMGGQGGGVLMDWLAEAARAADYPTQATSIPGVAQRTGATTYYVELFPVKNPPAPPVFSLFPDSDGLDLMIAMEPLEAGRALEKGLITKRTTVITATKRLYSTAEKMVAGDGRIPDEAIFGPLERSAGKFIAVDVDEITGRDGAPGNAAMFGAIAGSGVLPLDAETCRKVIEAKGVAVAASLKDFETGFKRSGDKRKSKAEEDGLIYKPAPLGFDAELDRLPEPLRDIIGHGLARVVSYQDAKYGHQYLERLTPIIEADKSGTLDLAREVARRLAAWMSYEDVIRVAQLKTREGRLENIRQEVGLEAGDPMKVVDFLKPGREELASLMPPALGAKVMAGMKHEVVGGGMRVRLNVTSAWGYGSLKILAALRPWRRKSYRFAEEQKAIEAWLKLITQAAAQDIGLAKLIAELAFLARGYGRVRARGLSQLAAMFDSWGPRIEKDTDGLIKEAQQLISKSRNDPDDGK